MNSEKWDALPEDLQAIFTRVSEQFHEQVAAGLWDAQNERALEWAIEETGQEVITLSEEEMEIWINIVLPIQAEFVEKMNEQGFSGEEILETVRRLSEEYQSGTYNHTCDSCS